MAADYPGNNIDMIVPFSAGGGNDTFVRALQPLLEEQLGPDRESQDELALATSQRNIAAVTVVATSSVSANSLDVLIMVVVSSLVGLAVLFPMAIWIRNRERGKSRVEAVPEKSVDG